MERTNFWRLIFIYLYFFEIKLRQRRTAPADCGRTPQPHTHGRGRKPPYATLQQRPRPTGDMHRSRKAMLGGRKYNKRPKIALFFIW